MYLSYFTMFTPNIVTMKQYDNETQSSIIVIECE